MAKDTSVSLDKQCAAFIEAQVAEGRFGSARDVVQAGLRLLEEREAQIEALRGALREGREGGPPESSDVEALLRAFEHGETRG